MNQRELQDEVAAALSNLALDGQREAYGFEIARAIQKRRGDRLLVPHGALYRALRNLENRRVIISRWERTEEIPKVEDRPRHRCYRLTGAGHDRAPAAARRQKQLDRTCAGSARQPLCSSGACAQRSRRPMMPLVFITGGLIIAAGGRYLIKNDVEPFAVPIFLSGLTFAAIGIIWAVLTWT